MPEPSNMTTNLEALRAGASFSLGRVTRIDDVGRYTFVEFVPFEPEFEGQSLVHAYVDGEFTRQRSMSTLEGAMVLAIAYACTGDKGAAYYTAALVAPVLNIPTL
jgi:hypothetical protein